MNRKKRRLPLQIRIDREVEKIVVPLARRERRSVTKQINLILQNAILP